MTSSFQALSCITTSINLPPPTSDDLISESNTLFKVTKAPHFSLPINKQPKSTKKIAYQNNSSAILEPSID